MMCVKSNNSCSDLFTRQQILTFSSEYVYSLINFITNNKEHFQTNVDIHSVNTRHKHCLHKPLASLSCFQKRSNHAGIKIFSNIPSDLKCLQIENARFRLALKQYLNIHSFNSAHEYLLS
jgi:hypothetical protein